MIEILKQLFGTEAVTEENLARFNEELGKRFVAKANYNAKLEEIKGLNTRISEHEAQLKSLKDSAGDNDELKNTIKNLQKENADSKTAFEKQLADIKKKSAIETAIIRAKAKDADMVRVKLNMDSVTVKEDGSIDGLDGQLEDIKKNYAFLFENETGYNPAGGKPAAPSDMRSALTEHYNKN